MKIKRLLLIIILILSGILGLMLYQMQPTDSEFYVVEYNSVANLDKTKDKYFLLVCDLHESQCQYIIEAVQNTDRVKYDIYYVDTTHYAEDIANPELSESERAQYASLFRRHMLDIDVSKIPTLQLRSGGEAVRKLEGFYSEEYNQALYESNELPIDIIVKLQKKYTDFVNKK